MPRVTGIAPTTIARSVGDKDGTPVMESVVGASEIGADPTVKTLGVPTATPTTPRPAGDVGILLLVQGVQPELRPVTRPIGAVKTSTPARPPGPVIVTLTVALSRILYTLVLLYFYRVTGEVLIAP